MSLRSPRARAISELTLGLLLGAGGLVSFSGVPSALALDPAVQPPAGSANISPTPAPRAAPLEKAAEVASYKLEAELDPPSHLLKGRGTLTWKNTSSRSVREIYLHLYLNAFKNDRSLFLRSPFGAGRSGQHAREYGYIDVTSLRIKQLGSSDLWPGADKNSPDDPDDQTDIRVPLPNEIAPGATVDIELEWTSKLPSLVERTGYSGSFHFVAQWFPKIARLEPDGTWAHFAFHPQAEFYADFGRYTVDIRVPPTMVVGATGRLTQETTDRGQRVLRYEADQVHDFAWTAWEWFRERRENIEGVDVRFLFPPGYEADAAREVESIRFSLPRFNRLYGAYPHPTLTVVHPPEHARNAGGMEYPTLITTGGAWFMTRLGIRSVEAVTVHELGHQWFQGTVATNEPAWPFLDEGVNQFVELAALDDHYGPGSMYQGPGLTLSSSALYRAIAAEFAHDDSLAQPAARFSSFDSVGALVYARTATVLATIGNVWGRDALHRAIGNYARRFRFQHPEPRDFIDSVRETMGDAPAETLRAALFDRGWVDFSTEGLECVRVDMPAGVFDRDGGREIRENKADREKIASCRVIVRREGSLGFPVDVDLVLSNGAVERRHWDGKGNWTSIAHEGRHDIVAALADPEGKILLDQNLGNNAERTLSTLGFRTLERATYVAELALAWFGP